MDHSQINSGTRPWTRRRFLSRAAGSGAFLALAGLGEGARVYGAGTTFEVWSITPDGGELHEVTAGQPGNNEYPSN